jgi:hypothetical protein
MPITAVDQERIIYHLGYLEEISMQSPSMSLGLPRVMQTLYLVNLAIPLISETAIPRVVNILDTLDAIECRLRGAIKRLAVNSVGNIKIRPDETDALEKEYGRWACRLCDILGAPLQPLSTRFREYLQSKGAGNISVLRA